MRQNLSVLRQLYGRCLQDIVTTVLYKCKTSRHNQCNRERFDVQFGDTYPPYRPKNIPDSAAKPIDK